MAWSAIVRRDATPLAGLVTVPLPRLQLDSLKSCQESSNSISVAVIDANALISFDSSARLLALACSSSSSQSTRFVTVKEVLEEVRAPASQFHLDALPCSLDCIDPSEEALQKVIKFTRATGDLASFSDVDLKVLALTYMLEEQTYGSAHLRPSPPPIHVAQVTHMRERDLPGWGSNVKNLEEWEQLSQEPDSTVEEGSHILGLSNLSIDTFEKGNTAPDEEQKMNTQTEESMTASEGKKVYVEKNTNRPVNEDECESAVREGEQNSMGQFLLVKDHQESLREVIYDGENCEDSLQNMEEQEIQAGGGWERAVSRSTRRKHEKRAARAAMKNLSTTKRSCTGIDSEDGEESVVDEIDYFQDGTISEEACPSISETSGEKKAKAGSNQDSESEASWALRPLSQSKVACVTADFPMQNVLLQIGLRVISPNGLQIQQLQRWALKCEACRNVTSDVGRIFCPKCGSHTQTEESMTASEGKKVYVEKNTNRPVNEDECESAVREGEQNSMGQFLLVKDHQESLREVIYDGENCEDSLQNMEEQEIQAGGGWERAVSRSTRRKHEKRAARAAMKNLSTTKREVESVEGNQGSAMVSQTDGVNSDAICSCTGIDSEDGEESVVDEIDYFQDGTISEEACPSISETSGEKKAKAGSNQDSESEASWALRPLSQSKVACVTADFPMQNVLLQIGLRVISPNGLQIQQLQRWALKCEACRNVTSDVGRIFCPKCGNGGTLYKVSITIGPNGVVHTGTKKRFNIRGTKYSLPLPKGGRQGVSENPILREDQLPKKMLRSKKKATIPDLTSPAEAFVMKSGGKEKVEPPIREALAIFSGKRNPNRPRSKQRG
ncbi:hypothetical protein L7F22_054169 [Adiantum nelumboides]|nr:hypothetical protein [Adiantum nelumboides]